MHTIKFVARHTGLSQHTIRAWERRYAALSPDRSATNRRLYSAADMEKLALLYRAIQAGHSIGQVARLSIPDLQRLLSLTGAPPTEISETPPPAALPAQQGAFFLEECLDAIDRLDARRLEDTLTRSAALLGAAALIDRVLLPLLQNIGERWREGEARPAHEHLASAVARTFLGRMLDAFQPSVVAPHLVVTTPVGQLHELGALIAAVTAASEGWRVLYLGPNLPAEEIAGVALQSDARAVALSIIYPPDDPRLDQEMISLRKFIGEAVPILVGGRAASAYHAALDAIHAIPLPEMKTLREELERLRVCERIVPPLQSR